MADVTVQRRCFDPVLLYICWTREAGSLLICCRIASSANQAMNDFDIFDVFLFRIPSDSHLVRRGSFVIYTVFTMCCCAVPVARSELNEKRKLLL